MAVGVQVATSAVKDRSCYHPGSSPDYLVEDQRAEYPGKEKRSEFL